MVRNRHDANFALLFNSATANSCDLVLIVLDIAAYNGGKPRLGLAVLFATHQMAYRKIHNTPPGGTGEGLTLMLLRQRSVTL